MDVRDEKTGLGFSTSFDQSEQPPKNILIKQSKIRFNFGSKTNMSLRTNRINFAEGTVDFAYHNIFIFLLRYLFELHYT